MFITHIMCYSVTRLRNMSRPVWRGRAPNSIANELNKIFAQMNLPYKAVIEGEPNCYETVRYGTICSYDFLPVIIVNKNGEQVEAELAITWKVYEEESTFGGHSARGVGKGVLIINNTRICFNIEMYAVDYMYSYEFKNPRYC